MFEHSHTHGKSAALLADLQVKGAGGGRRALVSEATMLKGAKVLPKNKVVDYIVHIEWPAREQFNVKYQSQQAGHQSQPAQLMSSGSSPTPTAKRQPPAQTPRRRRCGADTGPQHRLSPTQLNQQAQHQQTQSQQ